MADPEILKGEGGRKQWRRKQHASGEANAEGLGDLADSIAQHSTWFNNSREQFKKHFRQTKWNCVQTDVHHGGL